MRTLSRIFLVCIAVIALMIVFANLALAQDSDSSADDDAEGGAEMYVLQLNFTFDVTADEYKEIVAPFAEPISNVDGLLWKVWIINDDGEAGGIYLFENAESLDAYMNSEIVADVVSLPQLDNFVVKPFQVMTEPSAITHAPLGDN